MPDIDLLVLAAKALGRIPCAPGCTYSYYREGILFNGGKDAGFWNPLVDDGDALRLAVLLERKMNSQFIIYFGCQDVIASLDDEDITEFHGRADDAFAAARRAIVRAAAEIGKAMP